MATAWPSLAVVVPNYNGADHLADCLGSLEALAYPRDRLELILVDNASRDASLALVQRRFPRVRVLRNRANRGFAAACNQGVRAARAPLVALLNNDARVHPDWARALVEALQEYPAAAAAGARILDWTGARIDFAGGLMNFYGHAFQRLYGAPAEADPDRRVRATLFACGGAMAVRREAFLAVGGFDEAYFAFFEDVDLGWRLWVLGHAVLYVPDAVAYHKGHATASRVPAHQLRVLYERNALYTIIKNYERGTLERVLPAALLLATQRGLMSGRIATAPWVLGRPDGGPETTVSRLALSHFVALGELGLKLPSVWQRRAAVQQARQRPDAAVLPLFGEPFMPNHVEPLYLATQERLVRTLGLDALFPVGPPPALDALGVHRRATAPAIRHQPRAVAPPAGAAGGAARVTAPARPPARAAPPGPLTPPQGTRLVRTEEGAPALLVAGDPVGARMAGPGVRCWELARALARQGIPLVLAVPNTDPPAGEGFRVVSYAERPERLVSLARRARALIVQGFLLHKAPALATLDVPLVVDLYDPFILENLHLFARDRLPLREALHREHLAVLNAQLRAGDFFLCASERQRDFWLGMLVANHRLNPRTYDADPTLRRLIDVVPFGLPAEPPQAPRAVLKGVLPGVAATDRVLLWGGGLWEWFDPLTLLEAMVAIEAARPDVRLVFLGTRHPNPALPVNAMAERTHARARALGLLGRSVFFLDWVPYAERGAYLLEADLGVSLHREGIETHFAFRSRLLDCFWAGLPVVCTRGDALADVIAAEGLGRVVPPGDAAAVAAAILELLAEPDLRGRLAPRFAAVAAAHTWERAAAPLATYLRAPWRAPGRPPHRPAPRTSRAPRLRGRQASGAVTAIEYAVRPTPWWRLPGRAWHYWRLGGARRLATEVRSYLHWLRQRRRTDSPRSN
ncbi:MAG TPA: glycosyltransferase [Chloroflexota bacterium]|nr:glycosyltransferase [Chloroflexota bacterium]